MPNDDQDHHKYQLTPKQLQICQDVREISPLIAGYVEMKFKAGISQNEVWQLMDGIRNAVGTDPDEGMSRLTTAEAFEGERAAYDEDFPPHKVDGRNPDR